MIMIWYDIIWYDVVWYGMVWYGMVWYGMVWYGMVWYGMVWYGKVAQVIEQAMVWCHNYQIHLDFCQSSAHATFIKSRSLSTSRNASSALNSKPNPA